MIASDVEAPERRVVASGLLTDELAPVGEREVCERIAAAAQRARPSGPDPRRRDAPPPAPEAVYAALDAYWRRERAARPEVRTALADDYAAHLAWLHAHRP